MGYLVLSIVLIVGFVYVIVIQPNVLWLEFVMFVIALVITGIGTLWFMFIRVLGHDCSGDLL